MGAVYRGTQLMVDRSVAVKLLHPTYAGHEKIQARFEVEARAIAKLNHPNCITLYDFGYSEDMGAFYTVVEYIDGAPLEEFIGSATSVARIVDLIKQAASALGHAHHHGILHRDLKPENLMVAEMTDGSEILKVLDFGIAQIMQSGAEEQDDDFETERLTRVGEVFGTPPYMSPEQSESTRDLSPATDLYSLGIIFYELLEGRLPFMADTPVEIMAMHRTEQPPPLRRVDVPESIESLLFEMLAKDPDARPESGDRIVSRLDAVSEAELSRKPPSAAATSDDGFDIEPTKVTAPEAPPQQNSGSTLLGEPPKSDAVSAAQSTQPGEESELYELKDLVAEPGETLEDSDHADHHNESAAAGVKSTQLLDTGADPDDTQTMAAASRIAGRRNKLIGGVLVVILLITAALVGAVIAFEPFSMASEDDMSEVAEHAAPVHAEGDNSEVDTDDAQPESPDDDSEPESDATPPREVAVSADDDDEADVDGDSESDNSEDDRSEDDRSDGDDANGDQSEGDGDAEPEADPGDEPSPSPTHSEQQPEPSEPDDTAQDDEPDEESEQERPPRLGL